MLVLQPVNLCNKFYLVRMLAVMTPNKIITALQVSTIKKGAYSFRSFVLVTLHALLQFSELQACKVVVTKTAMNDFLAIIAFEVYTSD